MPDNRVVYSVLDCRADCDLGDFAVDTLYINDVTAVPEPCTMVLLGTGLIGAGLKRYRRG